MTVKTEPQTTQNPSLSSEERRCLVALADEGGFGARAMRDGYLALAKRHKGITLAVSLVRARTVKCSLNEAWPHGMRAAARRV